LLAEDEARRDGNASSSGAPGKPRIQFEVHRPLQDRIFRASARVCGALTLAIMALIFVILLVRSYSAVHLEGLGRFLTTQQWSPEGGVYGIGSLLFNTVVIAVVAMVLAVPVAICAALLLTEYAPRSLRGPLTALVDLLAAVPSVIFGYWGLAYLTPRVIPLSRWLTDHLGFIPIFKTTTHTYAGSPFIAGVVVSLMAAPILTAVVREVFSQAPQGQKEAALALGGTRWGMIRTVVLPFGRGGIIGGTMLALGRALGETVAVVVLISATLTRQVHILQSGANSISAFIAETWGEANPLGIIALMAAGLILFIFTLLVNAVASVVVQRSRSGAGLEL
jgi:phosphate transport system permease protein